jgi:hypothetical protein
MAAWYYGGRTLALLGPSRLAEHARRHQELMRRLFLPELRCAIGPDKIAKPRAPWASTRSSTSASAGRRRALVPDRAWKKRAFKSNPANQIWFPGESPSYGIGQGYVNVNALQLAVMTSRLANGQEGAWPAPDQVGRRRGTAQRRRVRRDLPFSAEHLEVVRGGMAAVANDVAAPPIGRASSAWATCRWPARPAPPRCAAMTGRPTRNSAGVQWKLKDHNLFVAFAPYDDPRYALSVIIEHGGLGGATAGAPRAREVMRVALLKDPEIRARRESRSPARRRSRTACRRRRARGSDRRRNPPGTPQDAHMTLSGGLTRPGERDRPLNKFSRSTGPSAWPVPDRRGWRSDAVLDRRRAWEPLGGAKHLLRFGLFRDHDRPGHGRPAGVVHHAAYPVYAIGLLLLVGVEVVGDVSLGAQRWLQLGPLRLQPSEIMKIGVVLALARYYHGLSSDSARLSWRLLIPRG